MTVSFDIDYEYPDPSPSDRRAFGCSSAVRRYRFNSAWVTGAKIHAWLEVETDLKPA